MTRRVLIAEDDGAVAAHLEQQLAGLGHDVVVAASGGEVIGQVLAGGIDVVVLDLPDNDRVRRDLSAAEFGGGVVVIDTVWAPEHLGGVRLPPITGDEGGTTSAADEGVPALHLHDLDHVGEAVEQVLELAQAGSGVEREELDVAATVAYVLSRYAPGTHMAGPTTGGVQVIVATLDPVAFEEFLVAVSEVVGVGSSVRLEHDGGKVAVVVTGARRDPAALEAVRTSLAVLGGRLVLTDEHGEAFSAQVPVGLSAWE
ncbi:hypothetical protein [Oryzobacter telluris]|uniref:hypothetical protein n=1 Tax=Oryzobacter telluris TaxID=3149179 RepID=UPI00370D0A73